jgi:hypothetical protein
MASPRASETFRTPFTNAGEIAATGDGEDGYKQSFFGEHRKAVYFLALTRRFHHQVIEAHIMKLPH